MRPPFHERAVARAGASRGTGRARRQVTLLGETCVGAGVGMLSGAALAVAMAGLSLGAILAGMLIGALAGVVLGLMLWVEAAELPEAPIPAVARAVAPRSERRDAGGRSARPLERSD